MSEYPYSDEQFLDQPPYGGGDSSYDLYDPSDYDLEDDEPETASVDDVIEWLENQGYSVSRDEFIDDDLDDDSVPVPEDEPTSRSTAALDQRFVEAYRSANSASEREELVSNYSRFRDMLHSHESNMVRAEPYIPQVEQQFEEHGLPPGAARDYIELLLATGNGDDPEVQRHAMAMAVGRHALMAGGQPGRSPIESMRLPSGESPGGGSGLSGELGSVLESQLKKNFPGVQLTPALKRELKEQGIL